MSRHKVRSNWIGRQTLDRIEGIRRCVDAGLTKREAILALQIDSARMNATLEIWAGHSRWPPVFDESIWSLHVRDVKKVERSGNVVMPTPASGIVERAEPRDPCFKCGTRADRHAEFGCRKFVAGTGV